MLLFLIQKRGKNIHVRRIRNLGNFRKGWHSDGHNRARRRMIAIIMLKLHTKKPNAPPEIKAKLPYVAKRMEQDMYRKADSFAEYSDMTTLSSRMKDFVTLILQQAGRRVRSGI